MIRFGLVSVASLLGCAAVKPDAMVTLHLVAKGECGEASLDQKFQALAEKFIGMRNGTCESEGYIAAKGSKDLEVPILGRVHVKLYKKPNLMDFALDVGSKIAGVHSGGPCCKVCALPNVKYVSVDTAHGRCGERCMEPKKYWMFKMFDRNLTLATGLGCRALGFSSYGSTVHHGVPPALVDFYKTLPRDMVTLYKMLGGLCGEATLNRTAEDSATRLAGLSAGTCAEQGYAEHAGSHAMTVPSLGEVKLAVFRKAGELDLVDALRVSLELVLSDKVTLFKISKDTCGEATIDKQFEVPAVKFAGLQEGNCKDHGFSEPAGNNKTIEVPVLGELKVALYKKAVVLI
mmetsp:Transcript_26165/g.55387  ORF Transcript_26165/g.55387 Transcript_26165/m.55387 type:complete len:346 (+) Transcript_26165:85-1122(+)